MKLSTKYTPIAVALAALAAGPAMADGTADLTLLVDAKVNARADLGLSVSEYRNDTDVEVEKTYDTDRYVDVKGDIDVDGTIPVGSSSASLTSQNQNNYENTNINDGHGDFLVDNNAEAVDNGLQGASGNIGLNISAGTNNAQDNSAALSKVDAAFVFAAADSISNQNAERNEYAYKGNQFDATLGGNTLRNASGNIAVNIAAGNSNLQANSLAASVNTSGTMAESTVSSQQTLDHNVTHQTGYLDKKYDTVNVVMVGGMIGGYEGTSDQIGDVYPDMWTGDTHPAGTQTGHFDLDTETQGGSDLNDDGGALAFNEEGKILLGGVFTGQVVTANWIVRPHQNNATLSGDALRGASGNIGVNITAGTNNLQGNHLSIASATGGAAAPGGGGGE
ncbi:hypothetical protein [Methylophaga sp.]|uniref:hypothetical protein n=1 Tax=Methylophaga sp. TaxID=2024840 RepID=UPI0013FF8A82|nr:hypothetical protein [Methylophaga sp.]MTI62900.1 hypothetical protein [Methylophaga sp.]